MAQKLKGAKSMASTPVMIILDQNNISKNRGKCFYLNIMMFKGLSKIPLIDPLLV